MSLFSYVKRLARRERPEVSAMPSISARFDAARSSRDFDNYWANADALDADSSHSKAVRQRLVSRSRYEVGNNGYIDGLVQTHANYLAGTGPSLRMQTASADFNALVESAWKKWAKAVQLRRKLWCMAHAKVQDGEAFAVLRENPRLQADVTLDMTLLETEQCSTPYLPWMVGYIDGIRFDDFGNPVWYDILPYHPGGGFIPVTQAAEQVPAKMVLHWFALRRPGQHRGIPEFRSTLNVGAAARRWREATLASAESAADFSVLLETNMAPEGEIDPVEPFSTVAFQKRMMVATPMGWQAKQMKAEHPNATYETFHKQQVNEQARPKSIPYNLAAVDSSSYNYSSGKLDHQTYFLALDVEREDANDLVLDPLFAVWFQRFALAYLSLHGEIEGGKSVAIPPHLWDWPRHPVADVSTEASAADTRLKNGTMSLRRLYSDDGVDFEDHVVEMARDYGVEVDEMRSILLRTNFPAAASDILAAAASDISAAAASGLVEVPLPQFTVGDRVRVVNTDNPHMAGQAGGVVALVTGEPAYGVIFDGMEEMGIHRWYVESELESESGDSVAAAKKKKPMPGMSMTGCIRMVADVDILAAGADGGEGNPRIFTVKAYTGAALQLNGWDLPVVVDLAGMTTAKSITANLHHNPENIVGHVTDKINDGGSLTLKGVVSGAGPSAKEFIQASDNGYPWQASIEAKPNKLVEVPDGKAVTVNGQQFTGPLLIARKSKLYGVAFVPRGADENTTVSVAASAAKSKGAKMNDFEKWTQAMGLDLADLSEQQQTAMRAEFDSLITLKAAASDFGEGRGTVALAVPVFDVDDVKAAASEHFIDIEARFAEHEGGIRDPKLLNEIKANAMRGARELKAKAIREKWTAAKFEVEAIKAASAVELSLIKAATPRGPAIHSSTRDTSPEVIEAALCMGAGLPKVEKHFKEEALDAAHKWYRNLGLQQVLIMAASQNGYVCGPGEKIHSGNIREVLEYALPRRREIHASGGSTLSLPGILSNIANKELLAGYMEEDQTWREVSRIKTVTDFKEVTSFRLLDNMEYEQIGPNGEIKHGSVGQESYTRKADTYAKMFALTRTNIINDDLGALDDLRTRLGMGGAKKFNNLFWSTFLNNAAFFTAGRGNYVAGATTTLLADGVGLELAITAFRKLRSPAADGSKRVGNTVGGRPELVLVPPELSFAAERLFHSTYVTAAASGTTPDANIHAGKYRPVVCDWLSDANFPGYSATAWYLLRAATQYPAMVVSFLNGNQTPIVESADADFDTLGIQFRGYHDFGTDLAEYLCGVKVKGAA